MSNDTPTNAHLNAHPECAHPQPCPEEADSFWAVVNHSAPLGEHMQAHMRTCERCAATYEAYQQSHRVSAATTAAMALADISPKPVYPLRSAEVQPPQEMALAFDQALARQQEVVVSATPAFSLEVAGDLAAGIENTPARKSLGVNITCYLLTPQRLSNLRTSLAPSFRIPDAAQWRDEAHYSFVAGKQLTHVYELLKQREPKQARLRLETFDATNLSIHQRLCLNYIFGLAELTDGMRPGAGEHFDHALAVSKRVQDWSGYAALACLRGLVFYQDQKYKVAIEYYTQAFDQLRRVNDVWGDGAHVDLALEVESQTWLASSYFAVGNFDRSWSMVEDVRRLLAQASAEQVGDTQGERAVRKHAAMVEWVAALIYQSSGQPERALRHAMAASEVYSALQEKRSLGRVSIVVADIALDLADSFADTTPGQPMTRPQHLYASIAEPYALLATTTLRAAGDALGEKLASLTQARFDRMMRREGDRLTIINAAVKAAEQAGDMAVLTLALTSRGDELQSLGEHEQAIVSYQAAFATSQNTDSPVLGVRAKRQLLYATETTRS